jgi:N-acetylmuramoyl-L-alanine amidase
MVRIAFSTGHGLKVRGASCDQSWGLDEVDEARRIVPEVTKHLLQLGHEVVTFNDDVSTTQNENLNRIVDWHNAQRRDLDISCHLNAYMETHEGMGCEVEYLTQQDLAERVSAAISNSSGLINRGARKRTDLFFLNHTDQPAILLEVCFVDSKTDADLYRRNFMPICRAIAIVGNRGRPEFYLWKGMVSWFGGPEDDGVGPNEDLAFIYEVEDAPHLFLEKQPPGTTGLARRLDPEQDYIAMRWDYDKTPRDALLTNVALVRAIKTGREFEAFPADWGPHADTGRIADISPGLMEKLDIETDDEVEVIFPFVQKSLKE